MTSKIQIDLSPEDRNALQKRAKKAKSVSSGAIVKSVEPI